MTPVIEAERVTFRYRRTPVLDGLDLTVPEGSLYALLGPNGAGKTTLMKLILGMLRPRSGHLRVFGKDAHHLDRTDRARIGYVAEGQHLPGWMTLDRLTAWLAPLYPDWDRALASDLRRRFQLPDDRKIRALSRGQRMKAALLCALAARPRLLVMDEPFTGMDAVVKDELVEGLLEMAGREEWTVFLCSHDIGELEMLADRVGVIDGGRMVLSEPMDVLRDRFKAVDVMMNGGPFVATEELPPDWLGVSRSGRRLRFVIANHGAPDWEEDIRGRLLGAARVSVRPASLREVFVAVAREGRSLSDDLEVSA